MIRIFMVGYSKNKGGVESYIQNLTSTLDPKKYEVVLCQPEIQMNGKTWICPPNRHHYIQYRRFWKQFFAENTFDVLYYNTCDIVSIDKLRIARKAGIGIRILHAHNTQTQLKQNHLLAFFHAITEYRNRKHLTKYATHFLSCSKTAAAWMFDNSVPYQLVNNGVNLERFLYQEEKRKACRQSLGIQEEILVGFIGRLEEQKNPFFLLEIASSLQALDPDLVFVLIGEGSFKQELQVQCKERNLKDCVRFLGAVENIEAWMSALDVLVLPSFFEGLPFVLMEAQASGLKCMVSDAVTKEANCTGLLEYISLSQNSAYWARQILAALPYARRDTSAQMRQAGFSIPECFAPVVSILDLAEKS